MDIYHIVLKCTLDFKLYLSKEHEFEIWQKISKIFANSTVLCFPSHKTCQFLKSTRIQDWWRHDFVMDEGNVWLLRQSILQNVENYVVILLMYTKCSHPCSICLTCIDLSVITRVERLYPPPLKILYHKNLGIIKIVLFLVLYMFLWFLC